MAANGDHKHHILSHPPAMEHDEKNANAFNDVVLYEQAADTDADPKEIKRILRKIDYAVVPYSALLYLLSFLGELQSVSLEVACSVVHMPMLNPVISK